MSLTPCSHDPNREKELIRKKEDPLSFGTTTENLRVEKPEDWKVVGLKDPYSEVNTKKRRGK